MCWLQEQKASSAQGLRQGAGHVEKGDAQALVPTTAVQLSTAKRGLTGASGQPSGAETTVVLWVCTNIFLSSFLLKYSLRYHQILVYRCLVLNLLHGVIRT